MTKLNIDIKDHKFRELLTYWRKIIAERLRRKQYYEDPRYGTIVLTRREFLKLLLSLGIAGAIATLGIGMFNAHWAWAQETTNPPPTPAQYNYGELNWLELTVRGTPLGEGLVAEYLFYEGSGTVLHDSSGNGNHLTIVVISGGSYQWQTLANGKYVLWLSGGEDEGACGYTNTKFIPEGTPLSITCEAIFLRESDLNEQVAFGAYDKLRMLSYWYGGLGFAADPRPTYSITVGLCGVGTIEKNKWYHAVWTTDRYSIDFYINDQLVKTEKFNLPGPLLIGDYEYIHIGHGVGSNQHYFGGKIALVRVWYWIDKDRKLTKDEIQLLYKLAKIMVPELP